MRFDYLPQEVDPLPGEEGIQIVSRPVIVVRAIGPAGAWLIPGLVDTGATETLLPLSYVARLGVPRGDRIELAGAGGQLIPAWLSRVDLDLTRGRTLYRWSARVAFVARRGEALWGHEGFLDHFTATFDGLRKRLTLRPNGTFPPPTV